jgi:carboxylate-amine ligase
MSHSAALHAFQGYGIELEYMLVDRQTLSVLPIAETLLRDAAGDVVPEVKRGHLAWSNELVLHQIELKNANPDAALEPLAEAFQAEVVQIDRLLAPLGARLMPGAMHPWMNPSTEGRLWPRENAPIYRAYDRIFDCKRHGHANVQSMHINLPFADDAEFARLHAAIRLLLPILPALAASSPIADGKLSGYLDYRMENYRTATRRVPSLTGRVVPDTVSSRAEYETRIFAPMYRDIAALDPEAVLRHEWLNCRGAIPRFDRNAIEIRVIDLQECPQADLAIAAAGVAAARALYDAEQTSLFEQQQIGTDALAETMLACIRDADRAVIEDAEYLRLLRFPERRCEAGELWRHLIGAMVLDAGHSGNTADRLGGWAGPLRLMLEHGPLARRILRAVGPDCSRGHLQAVYRGLCDCLEEGRMFFGVA